MKPKQFVAWRRAMGWTQKQAAKGLGVHLKTIGNYERGAHTIPRVVKLATERLATDKAAA